MLGAAEEILSPLHLDWSEMDRQQLPIAAIRSRLHLGRFTAKLSWPTSVGRALWSAKDCDEALSGQPAGGLDQPMTARGFVVSALRQARLFARLEGMDRRFHGHELGALRH